MLKKLLLFLFSVHALNLAAQSLLPAKSLSSSNINRNSRTVSDTLVYANGRDFFIGSFPDAGLFYYVTNDYDSQSSATIGTGPFFYNASTDTSTNASGQPTRDNFYHPWENYPDTALYFIAASDFWMGPAQAEDWLTFGPVNIPTTGATLSWYDRGEDKRNGYELWLSTTGMSMGDFGWPPVFWEADAFPSPTAATDTTWEYKSFAIPPVYSGVALYFGFRHNSYDMHLLYLDEILLKQDSSFFCDASFTIVQDSTNLFNYYIYTNSLGGSSYTYLWDFGDTTTSNAQYPSHTYTGSGPYQICFTISHSSGCSSTFCDTIIPGLAPSQPTTITVVPPVITNVQEQTKDLALSIFPNPSAGNAVLKVFSEASTADIIIRDLAGREVKHMVQELRTGENEIRLDLQSMDQGLYLVQLSTGSKTVTKRMVIAR